MSDDVNHLKSQIKIYVSVFLALGVLTVLTVWASYLPIDTTGHVIVALAIASLKAFLVAAFFMHLNSERPMIYQILIFTVIFFLALLLLLILSHSDPIRIPNA
jgi:cytochrome c oxidase subunit IV